MTIDLRDRGVRVVLLDIEGTTTPIAFVVDVLFPFARARLGEFLESAGSTADVADVIGRLAEEHRADQAHGEDPPAWSPAGSGPVAYLEWLMARDRKSPGLKVLQGLIWDRGYRAGELRGQVFADVSPSIHRWHDDGVGVAIYSSGSVLAQQRLFASLPDGDLTPLIDNFFDTAVGSKMSSESYRRIARTLGRREQEVLFVSDIGAELDAAAAAGMQVALSVRPGNAPAASRWPAIRSFDEIGASGSSSRHNRRGES